MGKVETWLVGCSCIMKPDEFFHLRLSLVFARGLSRVLKSEGVSVTALKYLMETAVVFPHTSTFDLWLFLWQCACACVCMHASQKRVLGLMVHAYDQTPGKQRWEDCKYEASLGCIERSCL